MITIQNKIKQMPRADLLKFTSQRIPAMMLLKDILTDVETKFRLTEYEEKGDDDRLLIARGALHCFSIAEDILRSLPYSVEMIDRNSALAEMSWQLGYAYIQMLLSENLGITPAKKFLKQRI